MSTPRAPSFDDEDEFVAPEPRGPAEIIQFPVSYLV